MYSKNEAILDFKKKKYKMTKIFFFFFFQKIEPGEFFLKSRNRSPCFTNTYTTCLNYWYASSISLFSNPPGRRWSIGKTVSERGVGDKSILGTVRRPGSS